MIRPRARGIPRNWAEISLEKKGDEGTCDQDGNGGNPVMDRDIV